MCIGQPRELNHLESKRNCLRYSLVTTFKQEGWSTGYMERPEELRSINELYQGEPSLYKNLISTSDEANWEDKAKSMSISPKVYITQDYFRYILVSS